MLMELNTRLPATLVQCEAGSCLRRRTGQGVLAALFVYLDPSLPEARRPSLLDDVFIGSSPFELE